MILRITLIEAVRFLLDVPTPINTLNGDFAVSTASCPRCGTKPLRGYVIDTINLQVGAEVPLRCAHCAARIGSAQKRNEV